jgi:hypothetical protein
MDRSNTAAKRALRDGRPAFMALLTIEASLRQCGHGSRPAPFLRMRKFLVIVVLAGLGWLFVVQKRSEPQKNTPDKAVAQVAASPRPVSEHNWMKHSLDRASEVKRQVAQQRKEDGTR